MSQQEVGESMSNVDANGSGLFRRPSAQLFQHFFTQGSAPESVQNVQLERPTKHETENMSIMKDLPDLTQGQISRGQVPGMESQTCSKPFVKTSARNVFATEESRFDRVRSQTTPPDAARLTNQLQGSASKAKRHKSAETTFKPEPQLETPENPEIKIEHDSANIVAQNPKPISMPKLKPKQSSKGKDKERMPQLRHSESENQANIEANLLLRFRKLLFGTKFTAEELVQLYKARLKVLRPTETFPNRSASNLQKRFKDLKTNTDKNVFLALKYDNELSSGFENVRQMVLNIFDSNKNDTNNRSQRVDSFYGLFDPDQDFIGGFNDFEASADFSTKF